jgi:hypothetical protein
MSQRSQMQAERSSEMRLSATGIMRKKNSLYLRGNFLTGRQLS